MTPAVHRWRRHPLCGVVRFSLVPRRRRTVAGRVSVSRVCRRRETHAASIKGLERRYELPFRVQWH